jgi:dienelactone hydrolase
MSALPSFDYSHDGVALHGRIAMPKQTGPRPAVLVMHHAMGLGAHDCERAQRLADAGYVALASDMYGLGYRHDMSDDFVPLFMAFQEDPQLLRKRILAAYGALRDLPEVDPARISAIGFCFGGQCVLELARSGADVVSVVSFHGLLTTKAPAQPGAVKAKVLAITGALDPYAPPADVQGFQAEMAEAQADWHLTVYGQGWHAFTDEAIERDHNVPGVRYDARLDRLSWAQATAFLEAGLTR